MMPALSMDMDSSDDQEKRRRSMLMSLQKGMAKPPFFEGNTGDKAESISTWWKQVGNHAKTYDEDTQAIVIKSFLRGSAALWLDSREREIGRDLTVRELADGLTQEYGNETTSFAALQRLESLSMASPGCSTLPEYNAVFNRFYNQCTVADQLIANRCYIKGLHPKYLKWIVLSEEVYTNLAEAKAAATRAVAKHDMMQLNYANFDLQKGRASVAQRLENKWFEDDSRKSSSQVGPARTWTTNDYTGTKVNLNSFAVLADLDTPGEEMEDTQSTADQREAQVAAISSSSGHSSGSGKRKGIFLTEAQRNMLRNENRCFKCYKVGHIKSECRSAAATSAPKPLNSHAPCRLQQ
jgi:hypothetical protein